MKTTAARYCRPICTCTARKSSERASQQARLTLSAPSAYCGGTNGSKAICERWSRRWWIASHLVRYARAGKNCGIQHRGLRVRGDISFILNMVVGIVLGDAVIRGRVAAARRH